MKTLLIACTICVLAAYELAARAVRKPDWGYRQELGRVEPGGFLPAGNLAWLPTTASSGEDSMPNAWLVLNVEQPRKGKANSYAVRMSAYCASGLVTIGYVMTFDGPNGDGRELSREEIKPPRFLTTTDTAGQLATSALCRRTVANSSKGLALRPRLEPAERYRSPESRRHNVTLARGGSGAGGGTAFLGGAGSPTSSR